MGRNLHMTSVVLTDVHRVLKLGQRERLARVTHTLADVLVNVPLVTLLSLLLRTIQGPHLEW